MSPAQRRVHRARIVQVVLGCIWILCAVLQFQPRMFGQGHVTGMMLPAAQGQPAPVAWSITQLAHFLANALPHSGSALPWVLAMLSLAVAVGRWLSRRVLPFLVVGVALQALYWVTGWRSGGS